MFFALTILSSLSQCSFHHATSCLLFASDDVLGIGFSAAFNIVLFRQLYDSSIVFWSCCLCFLFLKLNPFCFFYAPSLMLFGGDFPFIFYDNGEVIIVLAHFGTIISLVSVRSIINLQPSYSL